MQDRDRTREPRQRIIEAARTLFLERGVVRTRMSHIAEAAGIRRTHLYRYFENKDDVLVAIMVGDLREAHRQRRARLPADGPLDELITEAVLIGHRTAVEGRFSELGVPIEITLRLVREKPILLEVEAEYWTEIVDYGSRTGRLRAELDLGYVIRWILFLQSSLFLQRESFFGSGELRTYIRQFVAGALVERSTA